MPVMKMPVMKRLNQYLKCRGGYWNYQSRVPKAFQSLDPRGTIRSALGTTSLEIARARRDALAIADEKLWNALRAGKPTALDAYETARTRAVAQQIRTRLYGCVAVIIYLLRQLHKDTGWPIRFRDVLLDAGLPDEIGLDTAGFIEGWGQHTI